MPGSLVCESDRPPNPNMGAGYVEVLLLLVLGIPTSFLIVLCVVALSTRKFLAACITVFVLSFITFFVKYGVDWHWYTIGRYVDVLGICAIGGFPAWAFYSLIRKASSRFKKD